MGMQWIIQEGLHPGDRVIVEGTQKVREGTIVNATNAPLESIAVTNLSTPTHPAK
jgi:membrane fusion protein (multidrug efflux system)